ncbi:hypothetical protein MLD38_017706 [Melastoma candidum]|uniref:Uncharacterized protein n=1 Tax=Melastoma candidum TaxID=119954 RepID=A0ACB9QRN4_9MYRT|nr:hypothetical protein MLD38_017706 [Melastoma candidum]
MEMRGKEKRMVVYASQRFTSQPLIAVFFARCLLIALVIFHFLRIASARPAILVSGNNPSPDHHCGFGLRCVVLFWFDQVMDATGVSAFMGCSEVCPKEDAVGAFLEYLVNPLLPIKKFSHRGIPSLAEQESVAQQLHGVVILYNYYHRKRHTHLEFMGFDAFCKLLVILNRSLLPHMQYILKYDQIELDDPDKQFSLSEKRIMTACEICTGLDASKGTPVIEGWPISKVAVFLVDTTRENCFLLFNSMTQGVWSLIEKDVETLEIVSDGKQLLKKRKITKRTYRDNSGIDEDNFLQVAFLSLKATGINQDNLSVLESHTIYSISREKSASRLYIMQSGQTSSGATSQVSIRDFIGRLHGPLIQKMADGWGVTQVVEYLNLLPYADILSDWFSRNGQTISPHDVKINVDVEIQGKMKTVEKQSHNTQANNLMETDVKTDKSDAGESAVKYNVESASIEMEASDNSTSAGQAMSRTRQMNAADLVVKKGSVESELRKTEAGPGIDERERALVLHDGSFSENSALVAYQPNLQLLNNLESILSSKDSPISQAAWKVLLRKRARLSLQLRDIVDEIALCDKSIQAVLSGGQDAIALKLELMLEVCNDMLGKVASDERSNELPQQCWLQKTESNGLQGASVNGQDSCSSLDKICNQNAWILPSYDISIVHGGFVAEVTVKCMDLEHSFTGKTCSTPQDARNSAAGLAMMELRSMARIDPNPKSC